MSTITDADHIAHIEREWYEHLMERATWSESCAPATRRHIADQLARMLARGRVESSALAEGDLLIVDAPDLLAAGGLTRRTSQAVIARHHLLRSVVDGEVTICAVDGQCSRLIIRYYQRRAGGAR